jgi:hypothetical protein
MNDPISQILAECLDGLEKGSLTIEVCLERYPEYRTDLESLLITVEKLRMVTPVTPRATFQSTSRLHLVSMLSGKDKPTRKQTWYAKYILQPLAKCRSVGWSLKPTLTISGLIILMMVILSTITVQASNHSLPGDYVYSLKIGIEGLRLSFVDDAEDITLRIEFANRRQLEIETLREQGKFEQVLVAENLYSSYMEQATIALEKNEDWDPEKRIALTNDIESSLSTHIAVLETLLDKVPESAKAGIANAIQASSKNIEIIQEVQTFENTIVGSDPVQAEDDELKSKNEDGFLENLYNRIVPKGKIPLKGQNNIDQNNGQGPSNTPETSSPPRGTSNLKVTPTKKPPK